MLRASRLPTISFRSLFQLPNPAPATSGTRYLSTARPFIPSPQQQKVVDACKTHNVQVSAVPGSGKTATIRAIADGDPDLPMVVITYNKRLQSETAAMLAQYPHVTVYTFHASMGMVYPMVFHTDTVLSQVRADRLKPTWTGAPVGRVILDEVQDMTEDLYWATCTILSALTEASGAPLRLVVLGDSRQTINKFRGADARFLELAPTLLAEFSPYPWTSLPLDVSHRMSHANADFVNDVFLSGQKYIRGSHDGPDPIWIRAGLKDPEQLDEVCDKLLPLIAKYGPENTAFLAPYIRGYGRMTPLVNRLCEPPHNIPCAHPIFEDIPFSPDQSFTHGKVALATVHQFKGSERALVVLFGLDADYFKKLGRSLDDEQCPPDWFVALSRAKHQIVVLQSDRSPLARFMPLNVVSARSEYTNISRKAVKDPPPSRAPESGLLLPGRINIETLLRHIPSDVLDPLISTLVKITKVRPPLPGPLHINTPATVLTDEENEHFEAVYDVNSVACKMAFELSVNGNISACPSEDVPPMSDSTLASWLARKAIALEAEASGFRCRLVQMRDHPHDWLEPHLEPLVERMKKYIKHTDGLQFNSAFGGWCYVEDTDNATKNGKVGPPRVWLTGTADIIRGNLVWSIKLSSELTTEHALKALLEGYLCARCWMKDALPMIRLFNVRTGELWKIEATMSDVPKIVETLLKAKYTSRADDSNDVFLESCKKVRREVSHVAGGVRANEDDS